MKTDSDVAGTVSSIGEGTTAIVAFFSNQTSNGGLPSLRTRQW